MNEFSVGDYVVPRSPLYGIHSVGRVTRTYKVGDHPAVEVRWESGNFVSRDFLLSHMTWVTWWGVTAILVAIFFAGQEWKEARK